MGTRLIMCLCVLIGRCWSVCRRPIRVCLDTSMNFWSVTVSAFVRPSDLVATLVFSLDCCGDGFGNMDYFCFWWTGLRSMLSRLTLLATRRVQSLRTALGGFM